MSNGIATAEVMKSRKESAVEGIRLICPDGCSDGWARLERVTGHRPVRIDSAETVEVAWEEELWSPDISLGFLCLGCGEVLFNRGIG